MSLTNDMQVAHVKFRSEGTGKIEKIRIFLSFYLRILWMLTVYAADTFPVITGFMTGTIAGIAWHVLTH